MRETVRSQELRHSPLKKTGVAVVVVAGFFAVLVAAAHPVITGFFVGGALTAVVLTALTMALGRRRAICLPGTGVCLRLSTR